MQFEDYSVVALSCVTHKVVGSATDVFLADGRVLQRLPELSVSIEQELERIEFATSKSWEILVGPADMVEYSSCVLCDSFSFEIGFRFPMERSIEP